MMKHPILAAGLAALLGIMANAAQAQNNKPTKADEKFMTQAIQGDMAEVQMGKLAEQKGLDVELRMGDYLGVANQQI